LFQFNQKGEMIAKTCKKEQVFLSFSFIFRYLLFVMQRALRIGSCFYYYQQTTSGDFYNAKKDFYE